MCLSTLHILFSSILHASFIKELRGQGDRPIVHHISHNVYVYGVTFMVLSPSIASNQVIE